MYPNTTPLLWGELFTKYNTWKLLSSFPKMRVHIYASTTLDNCLFPSPLRKRLLPNTIYENYLIPFFEKTLIYQIQLIWNCLIPLLWENAYLPKHNIYKNCLIPLLWEDAYLPKHNIHENCLIPSPLIRHLFSKYNIYEKLFDPLSFEKTLIY